MNKLLPLLFLAFTFPQQHMLTVQDQNNFKITYQSQISSLKKELKYYPDFPKAGVLFVDFLPILQNPKTLQLCIDLLHTWVKNQEHVDLIVGLESRGFLIGTALALKLGIGFVPIRKRDKLPGPKLSIDYTKEYGKDILEISQNAHIAGKRVIIIDDLLATGGTATAAIQLIKNAGAIPIELITVVQVKELAKNSNLDYLSIYV